MLYWLLKRVLVGPFLHIFFLPWVEGREHVPAEGSPAILASNHLSFSDSIFLPLVIKQKLVFPAKSEYFTGKGIKGWIIRQFFVGTGQVPIDRSSGASAKDALTSLEKVLESGGLVGYYPEGTRSPDGRLYRGRTGIARLALETGAPVIPVAMVDTDKIQPPGRVRPSLRRVGIRFGEPMDFSRYAGLEGDRYVLRSVTDEIMYEIMKLSDQEYVDAYASRNKAYEKREAPRRRGLARLRRRSGR